MSLSTADGKERAMNSWCESCARKSQCYTADIRPKCYVAITSNDRTADRKTEPQTETQMKTQNSNLTFEMSDEPQTESNKIGCSFCENKDVCIDAFTEVSCLCSRYDSAERSE